MQSKHVLRLEIFVQIIKMADKTGSFALVTCAVVSVFLQMALVTALYDRNVPSIFYPFGTDQGDSIAPVNDDGSTNATDISIGFPFFNSVNRQLYVRTICIRVKANVGYVSL